MGATFNEHAEHPLDREDDGRPNHPPSRRRPVRPPPEQVARDVLAAIDDERFLVLPHPEVLEFFRRKAADYERWLDGMRRLQRDL